MAEGALTMDPEARSRAELAHQRVSDHESRCEERWQESRAALTDVKREVVVRFDNLNADLKGLYARLWWFIGLLLSGMGGVIVFLAGHWKG